MSWNGKINEEPIEVENNSCSFEIPEIGTYAIGKATSERVYLFNYGDECTSVTGGWNTSKCFNSGSVTKNASSMLLTTVGGGSTDCKAQIYTNNQIDLSDYTKFYIHFTSLKLRSDSYNTYFAHYFPALSFDSKYWPNNKTYIFNGDTTKAGQTLTDVTFSGDISTQSQYISIMIDDSGNTAYGIIDKIWLE